MDMKTDHTDPIWMTAHRGFVMALSAVLVFLTMMSWASAQQTRPQWRGWQATQTQEDRVGELPSPPASDTASSASPPLAPPPLAPPPLASARDGAANGALVSAAGSPDPALQSPPMVEPSRFQPGEYVLGVGDRLRIIVFGEEDLSGEFVVDSTGRVSFPLIGEIPAALSSVSEFQSRVEEALREGYLNDPRVSAEVLNFRPFYILGEVQRPGEYPFNNGLTVLNAVATAGGFTPLANQTRVFIKPAGEGREEEIALSPATPVAPGDTIRIGKGAFYILGEVTRPGEYPFSEGMTVLNAVATAGGFTYRANQGRVFIQREGADREQTLRLEPNLRIEAGDTIRIGERFF